MLRVRRRLGEEGWSEGKLTCASSLSCCVEASRSSTSSICKGDAAEMPRRCRGEAAERGWNDEIVGDCRR